jgi:hypothetical protein
LEGLPEQLVMLESLEELDLADNRQMGRGLLWRDLAYEIF